MSAAIKIDWFQGAAADAIELLRKRPDVTAPRLATLAAIARHGGTTPGGCTARREDIAAEAKISTRAMLKALKWLANKRIVTISDAPGTRTGRRFTIAPEGGDT